jgi:hypothetical protein
MAGRVEVLGASVRSVDDVVERATVERDIPAS